MTVTRPPKKTDLPLAELIGWFFIGMPATLFCIMMDLNVLQMFFLAVTGPFALLILPSLGPVSGVAMAALVFAMIYPFSLGAPYLSRRLRLVPNLTLGLWIVLLVMSCNSKAVVLPT